MMRAAADPDDRVTIRQLKAILLAILVITVSLWFGIVCSRLESASALLTAPVRDFGLLLLWTVLILLVVTVVTGIAAALLRGHGVAAAVFALSGLALLASWGWSWPKAGLSLLYVWAGVAQTVLTQRELGQRIRFSVRPVAENGRLVATMLALILAGSFYLGLDAHAGARGFSIPDSELDRLTGGIAGEVVDSTPLSGVVAVREEAVRQVKTVLDRRLGSAMQRIVRYIAPVAAGVLFLALFVVAWFLWWVPMLIQYVVFQVLISVGVVHLAKETVEVQRLVLQ